MKTMRVMSADGQCVTLAEIPMPMPGPGEIRVKVVASAVNPADSKILAGEFAGRFLHAKTSPLVVGFDVSGTVDALGDGVADLEVGTAVWGHLAYSGSTDQGAFAEYVTLPRESVAQKPEALSHNVCAAAATVALTSLQSMRDLGGLVEGGRVLIIGAGGGVGSIAVGIAKRLGAHVTAVCSTRDVERVKELGADVVIDRNNSDPLAGEVRYDVIFDTPAVHSYGACARLLNTGGGYVTTLPSAALFTGKVRTLFSSKHCHFVAVNSKRIDLELISGWLEDGLELPIDSQHRIADLGAALERQVDKSRSGRVVVDVANGWPS